MKIILEAADLNSAPMEVKMWIQTYFNFGPEIKTNPEHMISTVYEPEQNTVLEPQTNSEPPTKRKRRTKAEIEAAKFDENKAKEFINAIPESSITKAAEPQLPEFRIISDEELIEACKTSIKTTRNMHAIPSILKSMGLERVSMCPPEKRESLLETIKGIS